MTISRAESVPSSLDRTSPDLFFRPRALSAPAKLLLGRDKSLSGKDGSPIMVAKDAVRFKMISNTPKPEEPVFELNVRSENVNMNSEDGIQASVQGVSVASTSVNEPCSPNGPTGGHTRRDPPGQSMTPRVNEEQNPAVEGATQRISFESRLIEPEGTQGSAPPIPEVILASLFTAIPDLWTMMLLATSISVTAFTVYYSWNASFPLSPVPKFLWLQPDVTVFTVNLLSYLTTITVKALLDATCDHIRWSYSCHEKGMPFLSFIALSSATSFWGLTHLVFSPVPRIRWTYQSMSHRVWSFQRYIAFDHCH
jgi:hypothetical protein